MSKNHTLSVCCAAIALMILLTALPACRMDREEPVTTEPAEVTETAVPTETSAETEPPQTEPEMLPHMEALYAQNPDTVGWIRIDGTKLDYPLMFVPEEEQRYLHADFEGNYDYSGLPFIDKDCSLDPESDNLIIYGHNMANGTAFRTLMYYQQEQFWKEHPTIFLSTLYEEREYEIISCFFDRVYKKSDTNFKFYQFIDPETEAEFHVARDYYNTHSLYDTGLEAEYGDSLITLVTCAYHVDNGRFVVVARLVNPESAKDAAASAQ